MAELSILPEDLPQGRYSEGDIIHAFNSKQIKLNHCTLINDQKYLSMNSDGLRDRHGHFEAWLDRTYHYRAEKTNGVWELVTLDVNGNEIDRVGNHPRLENIDLSIARRILHPRHRVLGTRDAPVYHMKPRNISTVDLDGIWNAIETHSIHRATNCPCGVDHQSKIWGTATMHSKVIVEVDDFNELERQALIRPYVMEYSSGEQVRDHEGLAKTVPWKMSQLASDKANALVGEFDDDTGIYKLYGDGSVKTFYSSRNLNVDDIDTNVLSVVGVSRSEALDKAKMIGRDLTNNVDLSKAPWMNKRKNNKRKGNTPQSNPEALWNRRDKRTGQRLSE